jgi:TRAP-type mannitol/chloroaromatic compound transport system substrate-binding protein
MASLRLKTSEILKNYMNMYPRSIVEYFYEYNNDDECKFLYNSLPEDFQKVLDSSADDWIADIQKQNAEVLQQIAEVQKQRDDIRKQNAEVLQQREETWKQIEECRQRRRITEALNEEVLRRIELNRIEMQQLGMI